MNSQLLKQFLVRHLIKCLSKVKKHNDNTTPLIHHPVTCSRNTRRFVKDNRPFLNPFCESRNSGWLSRCPTITPISIDSNTLHIWHVRLTGQRILVFGLLPFLYSHHNCHAPVLRNTAFTSKDFLKIRHNSSAISFLMLTNSSCEMSSGPYTLSWPL